MDITSGADMTEKWKSLRVNSFKVDLSTHGNIRVYPKKYRLHKKRSRAYKTVRVGLKNFLLHRLILIAFRGNPKRGQEAMHLDGNPINNKLENLKWGIHAENMFMDRGNNHSHKWEKNYNAKINKGIVSKIRKARLQGGWWGRKKLARKYKLSETQVYLIANKKPGGWV